MSRQRVHQPYEIGGAPSGPPRRHRRQRGLDLAPCHGGPQPDGGPLHRPGAARSRSAALVAVRQASGRRRRLDGPARADRRQVERQCAPLQPLQDPRHLLRAARRHQQPHPVAPHGHRRGSGARRRSAAKPASAGTSRTSKRSPTESRTGDPGTVAQPSSFSYQPRIRSSGSSGRRGRGTVVIAAAAERAAGDRANHAKCNRRKAPRVTLGVSVAAQCPKGEAGAGAGSARLFARSGGNGRARHGVSVPAGKTSLVGGGDTQERPSHVRHRRTGDGVSAWPAGTSSRTIGLEQMSAFGVRRPRTVSAVGMSGPRLRD